MAETDNEGRIDGNPNKASKRLSWAPVMSPALNAKLVNGMDLSTSGLNVHSWHELAVARCTVLSEEQMEVNPNSIWETTFNDESQDTYRKYHIENMGRGKVQIGKWAPHEHLGLVRFISFETMLAGSGDKEELGIVEEYEACERNIADGSFTIRSVQKRPSFLNGAVFVENTISVVAVASEAEIQAAGGGTHTGALADSGGNVGLVKQAGDFMRRMTGKPPAIIDSTLSTALAALPAKKTLVTQRSGVFYVGNSISEDARINVEANIINSGKRGAPLFAKSVQYHAEQVENANNPGKSRRRSSFGGVRKSFTAK